MKTIIIKTLAALAFLFLLPLLGFVGLATTPFFLLSRLLSEVVCWALFLEKVLLDVVFSASAIPGEDLRSIESRLEVHGGN
jgi:uncharacterized membrane protein